MPTITGSLSTTMNLFRQPYSIYNYFCCGVSALLRQFCFLKYTFINHLLEKHKTFEIVDVAVGNPDYNSFHY